MRAKLLGLMFVTTTAASAATVPAALQPPGGSKEIGRYKAKGDQIYTCTAANGTGSSWTLKAPDAWLAGPDGKRFAHHFAGPTWEAMDGSKVTGKVIAKVTVPDAVPALLLAATETGAGALAGTRFVQRLDTHGGVAPTDTCTAGTERRVPYTASYVFWR